MKRENWFPFNLFDHRVEVPVIDNIKCVFKISFDTDWQFLKYFSFYFFIKIACFFFTLLTKCLKMIGKH